MSEPELPFDLATLRRTLSFRSGFVESRDRAYVIVQYDALADLGQPDSFVFGWDSSSKQWTTVFEVDWMATRLCGLPGGSLLLMGTTGRVAVRSPSGTVLIEEVDSGPTGPRGSGPLRDLRVIDEVPFVCGMARRVYARRSPGSWSAEDSGTALVPSEELVVGFNTIDGLSEDFMVAVGFAGEIWLREKKNWRQVTSPTNVVLHRVRVLESGLIYACGQLGTVLYGQGDRWQVLDHGLTHDDLWDMENFAGSVFLASDSAIYRLDPPNYMDRLDTGLGENWSYRHLSSRDGVLWSFGTRHIAWTENGYTWIPATP